MAGLPVSQNPTSQSKTQPKNETGDSGSGAGLIAVIIIIIAVVGILFGLHKFGKKKYAEQQQEVETKPSHEEKPDTNDDSYKLGEFDG